MDVPSLFRKAISSQQEGQWDAAAKLYRRILAQEPKNPLARQLLAMTLMAGGKDGQALEEIGRALEQAPDSPEALATKGAILIRLARHREALAALDRAIALKPGYAEAFYNRGNCRQALGRMEDALADYSHAIALQPAYEPAFTNRGNVLRKLRRFDEALADYLAAARLSPADAIARYHLGAVLHDLRRYDEALKEFDAALAMAPELAAAWTDRGSVLRDLSRPAEALASFDRALALKPGETHALFNRAALQWMEFGRTGEAIADLTRLIAIAPDYEYAPGNLLHLTMYNGDWRNFDARKALIDQGVRAGKRIIEPFAYQAISDSPSDLLAAARIYAAKYPASPGQRAKARAPHRRIRIGYVSGEFRAQATQYLAAGLYEHHDRGEFQVLAFDNGKSEQSPMRRRLEGAFDSFIAIAGLSDLQAAKRIAAEEIDILVNLNGYFGRERTGVFALRPALLQVNYLGFPGTLGAPWMDYILADRIVISDDERGYFSEQVVWLPNCYQVNDDKRAIPEGHPSRREQGLPDQGFVFANFNQSYKLTPSMFAGWMRILKQVPGSVLWLMEIGGDFAANLRREAEGQGIAGERLIFAKLAPLPAHLARLRLADLVLDTLPYNAHTTASDALWAGVPFLTCKGHAFAGRVGASLLTAIGVPELIARDLAAYEAMAVTLAGDPARVSALRRRIEENKTTHPLFDTARFARDIEAAYRRMWEIAQAGEAPRHFAV